MLTTWSADKQWNWEWTSECSWLLQTILEIIIHIVTIGDMQDELALLREKCRKQPSEETNAELYLATQKYMAKWRNLIRLMFDVPTALTNMKLINDPQLSGFCGTVASVFSLYEIFGS